MEENQSQPVRKMTLVRKMGPFYHVCVCRVYVELSWYFFVPKWSIKYYYYYYYRKTFCLSRTKSQKYFLSPVAVVFAQSIEARCQVENEDVVGAAPTGDAPTTSELSTILYPTKVRLMLEVLRYYYYCMHAALFICIYLCWHVVTGLEVHLCLHEI